MLLDVLEKNYEQFHINIYFNCFTALVLDHFIKTFKRNDEGSIERIIFYTDIIIFLTIFSFHFI